MTGPRHSRKGPCGGSGLAAIPSSSSSVTRGSPIDRSLRTTLRQPASATRSGPRLPASIDSGRGDLTRSRRHHRHRARWRRSHLRNMLAREDTTSSRSASRPQPRSRSTATEFTGSACRPAERARLAALRRAVRAELDAVFIITPARLPRSRRPRPRLEAGLDVLLEKPMVMNADEADGADRDPRPDRAPARRRVPRQPVAAGPRRGADDRAAASSGALLNVNAARVAGLARPHQRDLAPGPGDLRRRLPVRHGGPHAQHRRATSPARTSPRSPPGWRTMASRSTSAAAVIARLASGALDHHERRAAGRSRRRVGHPRVLRARHPADRDLGRAPRAPASRAGAARRCVRGHRGPSGSSSSRPRRPRAQPEPTRGRACGWRACGTRSASRPHVAAPSVRPATEESGMTVRVTVWNEFRQEHIGRARSRAIYPDGIHGAIADGPARRRTASKSGPRPSTSRSTASPTRSSPRPTCSRGGATWPTTTSPTRSSTASSARVLDGMGLIVLHSGHFSRIFRRLMGTSCDLKWREAGERERLWVVDPSHPIADGLGESFVLDEEEMYGEHFDIPAPDELVFMSAGSQGGEVFRSGCTCRRGRGRDLLLPPRPRDHTRRYHDPRRPPRHRQRRRVGGRATRSPTGLRQRRPRSRAAGSRDRPSPSAVQASHVLAARRTHRPSRATRMTCRACSSTASGSRRARRRLQPGRQPVRRDRHHRGRRRDRRAGPGGHRGRAPGLRRRPTGRGGRPPSAPRCSIASPDLLDRDLEAMARLETAQHRQGDAREPLGHGRRRARLPLLRRPRRQGRRPPRRRPWEPDASAASSTSRSACAG